MNLPGRIEQAIANSRARVSFGYPWWLRIWLLRDVIAITLGRRIYVSGRVAGEGLERLLRHELAHVRQINELGLLTFYWRYASEFVRHYCVVRSVGGAYAMISFEREAVRAESGPPDELGL